MTLLVEQERSDSRAPWERLAGGHWLYYAFEFPTRGRMPRLRGTLREAVLRALGQFNREKSYSLLRVDAAPDRLSILVAAHRRTSPARVASQIRRGLRLVADEGEPDSGSQTELWARSYSVATLERATVARILLLSGEPVPA